MDPLELSAVRNWLINYRTNNKGEVMSRPNFSSYTIEELLDCKQNIDKERWPERYQEILDVLASRVEDPTNKAEHDELIFTSFCEELRDDLTITIDDNLWPIITFFSKRLRRSVPSTFLDEVCPICAGELNITQRFGSWNIACEKCDMSYSIRERRTYF